MEEPKVYLPGLWPKVPGPDPFFDFCFNKPISIQEFLFGRILQQMVEDGEMEEEMLKMWYDSKGYVPPKIT